MDLTRKLGVLASITPNLAKFVDLKRLCFCLETEEKKRGKVLQLEVCRIYLFQGKLFLGTFMETLFEETFYLLFSMSVFQIDSCQQPNLSFAPK